MRIGRYFCRGQEVALCTGERPGEVQLNGRWYGLPLADWIECDSSGTPLTPDGGTPLTD